MASTPYIAGKNIEIPPSALTDVINPANQRPFARIFMAQEQHMRAAIDAADAAKAAGARRSRPSGKRSCTERLTNWKKLGMK